jgi:peroxiredoxin
MQERRDEPRLQTRVSAPRQTVPEKRRVNLITMRLFALLLLFTGTLFAAGELLGHHAPGFSLPDRTFKYHDPQDYRGRILVVEFMQTTCPHCAAFSKLLEEASVKYAGKVSILSIVNPPDTPDKVAQYAAANKVNTPILFDCGQIAASYVQWSPGKSGGFDIPRVFIIDATGVIRRDLEYNSVTKEIFEGRGLFSELDKLLQTQTPPAKH